MINRRRNKLLLALICLVISGLPVKSIARPSDRPRVIVTTDGEEDDRASMVRFLLTSNEFDVEAIVNSCSQFHWVGGDGWNSFQPVEWICDYIDLYAQVYDNLLLHDPQYPSPEYLKTRWRVGNIDQVGEYTTRTDGAKFIADILLDESDNRPIWLLAWGGCNTFAAALKIIEDDYPERMEEVARKILFYLIWEQDDSYQAYIRPRWERFNVPTIISDQFDCIAYIWNKVLPNDVRPYFETQFMRRILKGKGPLCDAYPNRDGEYNAEGDTPSFLHCIDYGLRNMESPGYGGWGGRYVNVRGNVWQDPLPGNGYSIPVGQYGFNNSWSKMMENWSSDSLVLVRDGYFRPLWRWAADFQRDFAARADWCVKSFAEANHHPRASLVGELDRTVKAGSVNRLDATVSRDPDGDSLSYNWYVYHEAGSYTGSGTAKVNNQNNGIYTFTVPEDALPGDVFHVICEVSDSGDPVLKSYIRVIFTVSD